MIKLITALAITGFFSLFGPGYSKKDLVTTDRIFAGASRDTDVIDSLEAELMEEAAEETEWSENGNFFRYAVDERSKDKMMILQKKIGREWKEAARYKIGKYGFRIEDWNSDGFDDIAIIGKRSEQIYIFDPGENNFKDVGRFGFEITKLEGAQNLFYDLFYGVEKGSWGSTLFRKVKSSVQKLAYAEFIPDKARQNQTTLDVYTFSSEKEKKLKESLIVADAKSKYGGLQNGEDDLDAGAFLKIYWKEFNNNGK